jgi:hypothetical protein
MLRKLLSKIRRPGSAKSSDHVDAAQMSERMDDARMSERDKAEILTPGHSDRAGQIGIFH